MQHNTKHTRWHTTPHTHTHTHTHTWLSPVQDLIRSAIDTAVAAQKEWERTPFEHRAAIFLRMADLLSTKYRWEILAATTLGQGKTVQQAEIDASCESIDFFRFAVKYAEVRREHSVLTSLSMSMFMILCDCVY